MNILKKSALIASTIAIMSTASMATEYTKGMVKKVDIESGKVTVKHEELKNLDMPAMTMVFRVNDDEQLQNLKEGQAIEFVAERVKGKLTLVEVK
ncbi:MAG: copper-binding protein [Roseovarius sp.]|nr:copper-binding protein [Roseovarius sp.]|tara:strand:- start:89 stop:373 length:285 start_codon:yes stop_codon:yes gene_type:complete